jgi:hypothetical protein
MLATMSRHPLLRTLAVPLLAGAALAQNPTVPPVDPTLPDRLKELKTLVTDNKMAGDMQAISLMQALTKAPEAMNPKDKERLAKGLGDVFRHGKLRTAEKDILYREASDALAKLGPLAGAELAKAYGEARFKDSHPLLAHFLLALGRTQDDKHVELLADVLANSPHDELRAAAGEAIGNFTALDMKPRRELVKTVIRTWGSLHQQATTQAPTSPNQPIPLQPQNAQRTLRACEGKWTASLAKLTGVTHTSFMDWQHWLNKNPNWTGPMSKKP